MDRSGLPEPPSIFSTPDEDAEPTGPWRPPPTAEVDPPLESLAVWDDERPHTGLSRRALIALGAGGILIMGLVGYVGASALGLGDEPRPVAGSTDPSASPTPASSPSMTPTPSPTASPTPSGSPVPSPTLQPQPASALVAGQWASVLVDVASLRDAPGGGAAIVGEARRGEIVFVLAVDPPTDADGLTWYRVVADPNEVGWVAGHGTTDQLLRSDAPSASLTWCGVPGAPSYLRTEQQLLDDVVVAGLPVPSSLLGRMASSAVEVMWGAERPVCLALSIAAGLIDAASLHEVDESVCTLLGTGALAPMLEFESGRAATLDLSLLDLTTSMVDANARDVIDMATVGAGPFCLDLLISGGADDTTLVSMAWTDACVTITDISPQTASLYLPAQDRAVELIRTPGSDIDPALTGGTSARVLLSARQAELGAFSLHPIGVGAC